MTLQEYITSNLSAMAAKDSNFRERYEDKEKSLAECTKYITELARNSAKGSTCVGISDDVVLGWAVHYYQEKDCKPKSNVTAKVAATTTTTAKAETKTATLTPKPKKAKAKEENKQKALELDLFGGF